MKNKEIVQALRCISTVCSATDRDCLKCGYFRKWFGCDADRLSTDAADLIERLTAENAALREKQRWVLVTERLPEKQQRVIVRCKTVGTTVGWIMFGEWVTDLGPGCGEVTHWMPLPEAPEEGDKHE